MLLLIRADGHHVALIEQNIGRHQRGIGEQAGVDVVGVPGGLVLELGHAGQFAHIGDAVEDPAQLGMAGNVALEINQALVGIKADGQEQTHDLQAVLAQLRGILPHGQRVQIDHGKQAVVLILQQLEIAQRADIVAQRERAGGLDAAEKPLFAFNLSLFHKMYPPVSSIDNICLFKYTA